MSDDVEEKQFDPTPQKLLEARKKGEIAKSNDLNTAAAYLGFLVCLYFIFSSQLSELNELFVTTFDLVSDVSSPLVPNDSIPVMDKVLYQVLLILAPVFLIPAGLVLVSITAQQSITFATTKVAFKLSRVSVISGIKNKFGRAGLFEFLKSFLKLLLFMLVLAVFIQQNFDQIALATRLIPAAALLNIGSLLYAFLFIIFALALTIGLLDLAFQYADHIRKNRMSRKELEDELKQAEGDPLMKQRKRQKAMERASAPMMAEVPNASVVIVNPTHYAVALKWDHAIASAPIVVAKGVDEVALRIREIAALSEIPIHSDPPAARSLHADASIGNPITPEHYEAVAVAIRFAEKIRRKRSRSYG